MTANNLWMQCNDIGPAPRSNHAMVYDSDRKVTILFGGSVGTDFFDDTWEWDGTTWTQVADTGPSKRHYHAMCYDSIRKKSVLCGGGNDVTAFGDTWEFYDSVWVQVAENMKRFVHQWFLILTTKNPY